MLISRAADKGVQLSFSDKKLDPCVEERSPESRKIVLLKSYQ